MILSYCHTLAINIAKYKGNISLLYFLFFQLEPHSGESIWRIRPNFNSHIFSYIQWIQGVMSNTSSMPHNFISLAQGWSHCTCCSVQEDSRWQGEEGARPPHADLWAHGWDRRGAHRCARGKACLGVVGCRKGRTREPGSRESERTAPLERWTPPGNDATWGGRWRNLERWIPPPPPSPAPSSGSRWTSLSHPDKEDNNGWWWWYLQLLIMLTKMQGGQWWWPPPAGADYRVPSQRPCCMCTPAIWHSVFWYCVFCILYLY